MSDAYDVHDLLNAVTLEAVSFFEMTCSRANDLASFDQLAEVNEFEVAPEMGLQLARDAKNNRLRIRVRLAVDAEPGAAVVDAGAEYTVSGVSVSDLPEPTVLEFANKVGAFTLIPYLRQGLADMTSRVWGSPLLMPIFKQGEIDFRPDKQDSAMPEPGVPPLANTSAEGHQD